MNEWELNEIERDVKRFYNAKKYEIVEMCACLEVFHFDDI
jgi:hypothetical protein